MNFNSITDLLENGISADEIVAQLENHGPKIARKIKQMLLGGYGSSEILNFISKDTTAQKEIVNFRGKPTTPAEIARVAMMQNAMNVPKGRDQEALDELKKATPYVLGAAAMALPFAAPELKLGAEVAQGLIGSQKQKPKSLFERLLGNVNPESLDPGTQKQLQFLAPIAEQFEKKGMTEKDQAVKKLKAKIAKILQGKQGFLEKHAMESDLESIAKKMAPMINQQQQRQTQEIGQEQNAIGPGQQALMAILQKIQSTRGLGG